MRWKRRTLIFITAAVLLLTFVRVRYTSLGWGGYWTIETLNPWQK